MQDIKEKEMVYRRFFGVACARIFFTLESLSDVFPLYQVCVCLHVCLRVCVHVWVRVSGV